jgi:hypothetical protein
MSNSTHYALVIGASGLIGWSVVNQLLSPYPSPAPYLRVVALVNRPLKLSDSFWPKPALGRPSLALSTGVDLLCSDGELVRILKEKVKSVESITHVYYCGLFSLPWLIIRPLTRKQHSKRFQIRRRRSRSMLE